MDEINQEIKLNSVPEELDKKTHRKIPNKKYFLFGLILLLILASLFGALLLIKNNPLGKSISKSLPVIKKEKIVSRESIKQWPNCSDIRGVVEENDKLYVACLGGLLILDEKSGDLSQLTTTDGINSSTLTSLVKDGDKLYIGSQNGVNI